eukprot:6969710-Pyramimonas_sp.AAC.1
MAMPRFDEAHLTWTSVASEKGWQRSPERERPLLSSGTSEVDRYTEATLRRTPTLMDELGLGEGLVTLTGEEETVYEK